MTKKKIGELEGTTIVTGDKNYASEHEYYMTLNGDNTYQKLEQRTNGDQFRLVLGGSNDGGGSSDVLWPALYKNEFGEEIMSTFVPEDVKPNTWCMVCGTNGSSQPACYPVLINEYGDYTLYSGISGVAITRNIAFGDVGTLLNIQGNMA